MQPFYDEQMNRWYTDVSKTQPLIPYRLEPVGEDKDGNQILKPSYFYNPANLRFLWGDGGLKEYVYRPETWHAVQQGFSPSDQPGSFSVAFPGEFPTAETVSAALAFLHGLFRTLSFVPIYDPRHDARPLPGSGSEGQTVRSCDTIRATSLTGAESDLEPWVLFQHFHLVGEASTARMLRQKYRDDRLIL